MVFHGSYEDIHTTSKNTNIWKSEATDDSYRGRGIMAAHSKSWDTVEAFAPTGSGESDKMATKRPNNRQICGGRETSIKLPSGQELQYIITLEPSGYWVALTHGWQLVIK